MSNNSYHPLVSICCIAYNHEQFIQDALEGFLMQQTTFPIEIVIGEDCSTDGTREILKDYAKRFPNQFQLLLQEHNIGATANFLATIKACKSKYLALCEGDDYWTDPLKLQKQFELLEKNPEYSGCFHDAYKLNEETGVLSQMSGRRHPSSHNTFSTEDLVQGGLISTCSFFFRRDSLSSYPDSFRDLPTGDIPLFVLVSQKGEIGFINEVMSVYRIHNQGVWSGSSIEIKSKQNIQVNEILDRYLDYKYHEKIMPSLFLHWHDLALVYSNCNKRKEARYYINKCIVNLKYHKRVSNRKLVRTILKVYFPTIIKISNRSSKISNSIKTN